MQEFVAQEVAVVSRRIGLARLKALALAEERLRNGTYGRCEDCGQPIPSARLKALPEAARCVLCAEQHAIAA